MIQGHVGTHTPEDSGVTRKPLLGLSLRIMMKIIAVGQNLTYLQTLTQNDHRYRWGVQR